MLLHLFDFFISPSALFRVTFVKRVMYIMNNLKREITF